MQRSAWILIVFVTTIAVCGFAQDGVVPIPDVSATILGPPLMAWTQMQKPEPVPEPTPKPAPLPDPQSEQQAPAKPETSQPEAPAQSSHAQPAESNPASRMLTGRIVKAQSKFVLITADNLTYQLDDQERAKEFEGKQVNVLGSLDVSNNMIHVEKIELAS